MVIELKRDKVVAQTDRYMEWVKQNLAQADQRVRGIIIARSIDQHLQYILPRRPDINALQYDWELKLSKWAAGEEKLHG